VIEHRISIGLVIEHDDGIMEIVVDGGINVDIDMVREMLAKLESIQQGRFRILVNRQNSYSISFAAQKLLSDYPAAHAVAVLTHSRLGMMFARFIPKTRYNLKVFMDRDAALYWLRNA